MDQSTIAFVKGVIAFLLVAGTGAGLFWLWLRSRAHPSPDLERMIDGVREENAYLHSDLMARMAELEERIDFAESRLVQDRESSRLPSPLERTPV
jgi:hypothetical protein